MGIKPQSSGSQANPKPLHAVNHASLILQFLTQTVQVFGSQGERIFLFDFPPGMDSDL